MQFDKRYVCALSSITAKLSITTNAFLSDRCFDDRFEAVKCAEKTRRELKTKALFEGLDYLKEFGFTDEELNNVSVVVIDTQTNKYIWGNLITD